MRTGVGGDTMVFSLSAGFSRSATLTLLLFATIAPTAHAGGGNIVVANRNSASISVIDITNDSVNTIAMPAGTNTAQPMYVGYSATYQRVFVGDRANNRIVVFSAVDFSVEDTVPAGAGVFHMWPSDARDQLWVNNDIDNTITVIDTVTLAVLATAPVPADLVALGGKPHDVILDPTAPFAYVSVIGVAGPQDYVVKYSADTFLEVGRQAVGKDPHLSIARQNKLLYVPCQNSNAVFVLDRDNLEIKQEIPVSSAHGAGMARNGKLFYTTNIAGGGVDGLVVIDTESNTVIDALDTPFGVPHNIALSPNGKKVYITHSGATASEVSVFARKNRNQPLSLVTTVVTSLNPFGLAYVP
jgi:DNA-binding beta-propeller fold protein YncE